jgi:hypothetical protein
MLLEENYFTEKSPEIDEVIYKQEAATKKEMASSSQKHYDFTKTFEGIYLQAGKDEDKQIEYTIKQALKLEGLLGEDEKQNNTIVGTINKLFKQEPEMKSNALHVIQRFGK